MSFGHHALDHDILPLDPAGFAFNFHVLTPYLSLVLLVGTLQSKIDHVEGTWQVSSFLHASYMRLGADKPGANAGNLLQLQAVLASEYKTC